MKTFTKYSQEYLRRDLKQNPHNTDFSCIHCHNPVSASALLSRVQNRNHCPYCLWSRHLDLFEPGDRLSACKAGMHPIGLAFKRRRNRYAPSPGELMIVHQCSDCGRLSLNRSAADDDPALILSLPELFTVLPAEVAAQLIRQGIEMLPAGRIIEVRRQLEGALTRQGEF